MVSIILVVPFCALVSRGPKKAGGRSKTEGDDTDIFVAVHAQRLDLLDDLGLVVAILLAFSGCVATSATQLARLLADRLEELGRVERLGRLVVCSVRRHYE